MQNSLWLLPVVRAHKDFIGCLFLIIRNRPTKNKPHFFLNHFTSSKVTKPLRRKWGSTVLENEKNTIMERIQ